ncbi:MAG: hypothetical protein LBE02_04345 [Spirochaetaceae bacterium]|jgi:hypothetical protein|nr:hypothetical protein [Spirochaetaceae bacterium]
MKKKSLRKQCIPALLALAALAGCKNPSSGTASGTPASASFTITGAPEGLFYSLSVFDQDATIMYNPKASLTQLTGYRAQGIGAGNSTSFTIKVSSEISAGNYVLVLGVSTDMSTGKMYITGNPGSPAKRKAIPVTPGGTIVYGAAGFIPSTGGYTAHEIVDLFGTP